MSKMLEFVFPVDGDCLNSRDGDLNGNTLTFTVKVKAPEGHEVYICGKKAGYDGEFYTAEAEIAGY